MADIDALQQQAAEKWRDKHRTRQYEPSAEPEPDLLHNEKLQKQHRLEHPGLEDDLEL